MATGRRLESESYVAGADLSTTGQFRIVRVTGTDTVDLCTANGRGIGVNQDKPKLGEPCEVMQLGISKVVSDGSGTAIVAGDDLVSGANGVAVKSTGATGQNVVGRATEPSSANGVIIGIDLTHGRSTV